VLINWDRRQKGVQHDCGWPSPSPRQLITFSNSDLLRRANNFVWVKSDFALGTSRLSSRVRELFPHGKQYLPCSPARMPVGLLFLDRFWDLWPITSKFHRDIANGPNLTMFMSNMPHKRSQEPLFGCLSHSGLTSIGGHRAPVKLFSASTRLSTPSNQNLTSFAP
jgi:hypothetical protein